MHKIPLRQVIRAKIGPASKWTSLVWSHLGVNHANSHNLREHKMFHLLQKPFLVFSTRAGFTQSYCCKNWWPWCSRDQMIFGLFIGSNTLQTGFHMTRPINCHRVVHQHCSLSSLSSAHSCYISVCMIAFSRASLSSPGWENTSGWTWSAVYLAVHLLHSRVYCMLVWIKKNVAQYRACWFLDFSRRQIYRHATWVSMANNKRKPTLGTCPACAAKPRNRQTRQVRGSENHLHPEIIPC